MRAVILTCKHHPDLRWSCKEIAFSNSGGYNHCRNIFFGGISTGEMFHDGSGLDTTMVRPDGSYVDECKCPASDLIRAPEDKDVK